jgi:hypothetical protein
MDDSLEVSFELVGENKGISTKALLSSHNGSPSVDQACESGSCKRRRVGSIVLGR